MNQCIYTEEDNYGEILILEDESDALLENSGNIFLEGEALWEECDNIPKC